MHQRLHLHQQGFPFDATGGSLIYQRHRPFAVSSHKRFNQRQCLVVIERPEHRADNLRSQLPITAGNCLIGKAQRITQAAVCGAGQQLERTQFVGNTFGIKNVFKLLTDLINVQRFKMKLQTTRQNRHRQFLRIGRRQQEFDVLRRLFKRLQQRVKAVAREHVHFVNKVDLETATRGGVLHVIQQVTGIFDLGAGCRINFD